MKPTNGFKPFNNIIFVTFTKCSSALQCCTNTTSYCAFPWHRSTNSPACFQLYLTSYIWSIVIQSTKPRTIKRLLTVCCYMLTTSCLSGRKRTRSVFTSANIWLLILILTLDHVLIVPQLLQNEIKLVGCCVGLYNWKCIGINVWWMSFIHSGSFRGSLHQQDGHQTAQISYN